jgi:hypothetical protein
MALRPSRRAGLLGSAALVAALAALMASSEGCEALIGSDVPAFECMSGTNVAVCPGDEVCDPTSHQCKAPCSRSACASGFVCDPSSGLCFPEEAGGDDSAPPMEAGGGDGDATMVSEEAATMPEVGPTESGCGGGVTCPCSGPSSCNAGLVCVDSAEVPGGINGGNSFCTMPCCTSTDCAAGTVCFAAVSNSTGGNYCVDPTWLMRTGGLGSAIGGAACPDGNRDCRSGLCGSNGFCADTCCSTNASSTECSGSECRFANFPGVASFDQSFVAWCGSGGTHGNGSSCSQSSECESELCVGTISGNCSNACRNTTDCGGQGQSCAYVTIGSNIGVIAACAPGGGSKTEGETCTDDTECQSQFCDATSKECTDVCFGDVDCTYTGWKCRPEQVQIQGGGSYYVLACGT